MKTIKGLEQTKLSELKPNLEEGNNKIQSSFQMQNNSQIPFYSQHQDFDTQQYRKAFKSQVLKKNNHRKFNPPNQFDTQPQNKINQQYTQTILTQIRTGIALVDSNLQLVYINRFMKQQLCSQNLDTLLEKLLHMPIKKKQYGEEEIHTNPQDSCNKRNLQKECLQADYKLGQFEQSLRDNTNNSQKSKNNSNYSMNGMNPLVHHSFLEKTHSFNGKTHYQNDSFYMQSERLQKNQKKLNQFHEDKRITITQVPTENNTNGGLITQSEKWIKEYHPSSRKKPNLNCQNTQGEDDKSIINKISTKQNKYSDNYEPQDSLSDSFGSYNCQLFEGKQYHNNECKMNYNLKTDIQNIHQLLIPTSILNIFKRQEIILLDIFQFLFNQQNSTDKQNCWSCNDLNEKKKLNEAQKYQLELANQNESTDIIYFIENNNLIINFKEKKNGISFRKLRIGFYSQKRSSDSLDLSLNDLLMIELFEEYQLSKTIEDHEISQYKNRMLASVSHELRTPLNCSIQLLQMLLSKFQESIYTNQDDEVQDQIIKPALNSNLLLLNIINDILDYGQINQGRLQLTFSPFSIFDAVNECADLIFYQAGLKGLSIQLQFDANLPDMIHSDQNRLKQVLLNILSNSLKFTDHGYIQVNVFLESYDLIRIEVSDTGCGIPKDNLEKVLEAFGNISSAKCLNTSGAGLGMSIANYLALAIGKNRPIQIQSKLNEGSTFTFYIVNRAMNKKGCQFRLKDIFDQKISKWESQNKSEIQSSFLSSIKIITQGKVKSLKSRINLDYNSPKPDLDNLTIDNNTNTITVTYKLEQESQIGNQNKYSSHAPSQNNSSNLEGANKSKLNMSVKFSQIRNSLHDNEFIQQLENINENESKSSQLESCQILEEVQNDIVAAALETIIPKKLMKEYFKDCLTNVTNGEEIFYQIQKRRSLESTVCEDSKTQNENNDFKNNLSIRSPTKITSKKNKSQQSNKGKKKCFEKNGQGIQAKQFSENSNGNCYKFINNQISGSQTNIIQQETVKMLKQYHANAKCNCSQILIVDDNDFNIHALQMRLKQYGFDSDKVTSGIIAIDKVIQKFKQSDCCQNYSLILMDIDMPIKDGYQTTKDILKFYQTMKHDPPLISACSAYVQESEKKKAFSSGMSYYLTKPINTSELESILQQIFLKIQ